MLKIVKLPEPVKNDKDNITEIIDFIGIKKSNSKLKFFYNGIKDSTGRLHKCFISYGHNSKDERVLRVYSKTYEDFSEEIKTEFQILNDTDVYTDYFEKDRFTIPEDSQYFKPAIKAVIKYQQRLLAKITKDVVSGELNRYALINAKNDIKAKHKEIALLEELCK